MVGINTKGAAVTIHVARDGWGNLRSRCVAPQIHVVVGAGGSRGNGKGTDHTGLAGDDGSLLNA